MEILLRKYKRPGLHGTGRRFGLRTAGTGAARPLHTLTGGWTAAGGLGWMGSVMSGSGSVAGRREGGAPPPGDFDPTPPAGGPQGPAADAGRAASHGSGMWPTRRAARPLRP